MHHIIGLNFFFFFCVSTVRILLIIFNVFDVIIFVIIFVIVFDIVFVIVIVIIFVVITITTVALHINITDMGNADSCKMRRIIR